MAKLAVVILSDTETHADHGRLTNALELVKETNQEGGDARIVFDGACAFCSAAFEVKAEIQKTDIPLLSDFEGHPSLHGYIAKGYQIITF